MTESEQREHLIAMMNEMAKTVVRVQAQLDRLLLQHQRDVEVWAASFAKVLKRLKKKDHKK
jgi:hypothetical protein